MAKVFLVTNGDYSAYHVVAAFTTEALADEFRAWYGSGEVEEYELDEVPQMMHDGLHGYCINMWRDGSGYIESEPANEPFATRYHFDQEMRRDQWPHWLEHILRVRTVAKSEEHAVKIANETRTQLIANEQWPEE